MVLSVNTIRKTQLENLTTILLALQNSHACWQMQLCLRRIPLLHHAQAVAYVGTPMGPAALPQTEMLNKYIHAKPMFPGFHGVWPEACMVY